MRLERMDLAPLADCGREQERVLADVGAAVERNHSRLEERAERFGNIRIRAPAVDVDTGRGARPGEFQAPTRYGYDEGSTRGEKPVSMPAHAAVDGAHGMVAKALARTNLSTLLGSEEMSFPPITAANPSGIRTFDRVTPSQ